MPSLVLQTGWSSYLLRTHQRSRPTTVASAGHAPQLSTKINKRHGPFVRMASDDSWLRGLKRRTYASQKRARQGFQTSVKFHGRKILQIQRAGLGSDKLCASMAYAWAVLADSNVPIGNAPDSLSRGRSDAH